MEEIETVNTFAEYIKNYNLDCMISECELILEETIPYIGASPGWLTSCSCCEKVCIETKCPYSINYTEPNEQNLDYSETSREGPEIFLSTFFSIPNLMFCKQIYFQKGLLTHAIVEYKNSH